jgi:hypothetical protein
LEHTVARPPDLCPARGSGRRPAANAVRRHRYHAAIAETAPTTPASETPAEKAQRWRGFLSFILLALSILCLIVGSLFVWMRATAYNPNGYVASALQVEGQVAIQNALVNYITEDVLPPSQVESLATQAADQLPIPPARQKLVAGVLAAGFNSQIQNIATNLVSQVGESGLAVRVTQRASEEAVALLRNKSSVFQYQGDSIVFNTAPIIKQARAKLDEQLGNLSQFLPPPRTEGFPTYVLVQGAVVTTIQSAVSTIDLMSWLLPLLFVILLALGLFVARQRRSAAFRVMIAIAVSAVVVLIGIRIAKSAITGLINDPPTQDVVDSILNAASTNLVDQTLWLALLAAVIGAALWFFGPDTPARAGRAWMVARGHDLITGQPGPAGRVTQFAREHRAAILVTALAVGVLILLLISNATATTWLMALISYLILGFLVEYANCAGWMQAVVRWFRDLRSKPAT